MAVRSIPRAVQMAVGCQQSSSIGAWSESDSDEEQAEDGGNLFGWQVDLLPNFRYRVSFVHKAAVASFFMAPPPRLDVLRGELPQDNASPAKRSSFPPRASLSSSEAPPPVVALLAACSAWEQNLSLFVAAVVGLRDDLMRVIHCQTQVSAVALGFRLPNGGGGGGYGASEVSARRSSGGSSGAWRLPPVARIEANIMMAANTSAQTFSAADDTSRRHLGLPLPGVGHCGRVRRVRAYVSSAAERAIFECRDAAGKLRHCQQQQGRRRKSSSRGADDARDTEGCCSSPAGEKTKAWDLSAPYQVPSSSPLPSSSAVSPPSQLLLLHRLQSFLSEFESSASDFFVAACEEAYRVLACAGRSDLNGSDGSSSGRGDSVSGTSEGRSRPQRQRSQRQLEPDADNDGKERNRGGGGSGGGGDGDDLGGRGSEVAARRLDELSHDLRRVRGRLDLERKGLETCVISSTSCSSAFSSRSRFNEGGNDGSNTGSGGRSSKVESGIQARVKEESREDNASADAATDTTAAATDTSAAATDTTAAATEATAAATGTTAAATDATAAATDTTAAATDTTATDTTAAAIDTPAATGSDADRGKRIGVNDGQQQQQQRQESKQIQEEVDEKEGGGLGKGYVGTTKTETGRKIGGGKRNCSFGAGKEKTANARAEQRRLRLLLLEAASIRLSVLRAHYDTVSVQLFCAQAAVESAIEQQQEQEEEEEKEDLKEKAWEIASGGKIETDDDDDGDDEDGEEEKQQKVNVGGGEEKEEKPAGFSFSSQDEAVCASVKASFKALAAAASLASFEPDPPPHHHHHLMHDDDDDDVDESGGDGDARHRHPRHHGCGFSLLPTLEELGTGKEGPNSEGYSRGSSVSGNGGGGTVSESAAAGSCWGGALELLRRVGECTTQPPSTAPSSPVRRRRPVMPPAPSLPRLRDGKREVNGVEKAAGEGPQRRTVGTPATSEEGESQQRWSQFSTQSSLFEGDTAPSPRMRGGYGEKEEEEEGVVEVLSTVGGQTEEEMEQQTRQEEGVEEEEAGATRTRSSGGCRHKGNSSGSAHHRSRRREALKAGLVSELDRVLESRATLPTRERRIPGGREKEGGSGGDNVDGDSGLGGVSTGGAQQPFSPVGGIGGGGGGARGEETMEAVAWRTMQERKRVEKERQQQQPGQHTGRSFDPNPKTTPFCEISQEQQQPRINRGASASSVLNSKPPRPLGTRRPTQRPLFADFLAASLQQNSITEKGTCEEQKSVKTLPSAEGAE